jgi:DUF971 family protein
MSIYFYFHLRSSFFIHSTFGIPIMHSLPTSLEKTSRRSLRIQWSDGAVLEYPFGRLRDACPCATCKEKKKAEASRPRNSLNVLSPQEAVELDVLEMRPVGNYAYNITFSDGHSSGLFTMELLRELGLPNKESPAPEVDVPTQSAPAKPR